MRTEHFTGNDTTELRQIAESAFVGDDSNIDKWFSFDEMIKNIGSGRGACIMALSENGAVLGFIYAEQESPINGIEGREKWVIVITAIEPNLSGKGIGTALLNAIETQAKLNNVLKLFVYTNKDDIKVINFYIKNGYSEAGQITDYQYGRSNTPIFLLKYLA